MAVIGAGVEPFVEGVFRVESGVRCAESANGIAQNGPTALLYGSDSSHLKCFFRTLEVFELG